MSGKYLAARDAFGEGSLSWTNDTILAQLVSAAYSFNETDTALTGKVGTAVELTGKAFADGWARANGMVFKQVKGPSVTAIVFHRADGLLIEYCDAVQDFPMVPNGGDIEVDVIEPGIFRI